jgi:glycosyltransferase involved in cell wall biosynthesis
MTFPETWQSLPVALSHDWLTGMRGGERVLEILCDGFPAAPIYTLIHNPAAISARIERHPVHTSWLQSLPGVLNHYRRLLPLFPFAVHAMPRPEADLIVSTSHCVAKALAARPGARHLCYCFTPMRYAWTFHDEYLGRNPLKRLAAGPLLAGLRIWDRRTASRVTRFVAISRHVRDRIRRFYGRDADVVYPPVDTDRCTPGPALTSGYDLIVSALVPYKRVDLAVEAYRRSGYQLKIVGVGGEFQKLRTIDAPNVELLGWQSDATILDLYRGCRMLIFPGEEDFGIVPLEAQACGKPVVAFARGGALETVVSGQTGVFFEAQTPEALQAAVNDCAATRWDTAAIRGHAQRFGIQTFIDGMARAVNACLSDDPIFFQPDT